MIFFINVKKGRGGVSNIDNTDIKDKKSEEIVLGFCSKFQPQLAPHAVGPGKTLINYKVHYFPCMGDKCTDSWCHEHQMCRYACEHLEDFHSEEGGEENQEINNENLSSIDNLVDKL